MIGIIGAMQDEVETLMLDMNVEEKTEYASMVFHKGNLCSQNVVIVKSGIGKVNAAICAPDFRR